MKKVNMGEIETAERIFSSLFSSVNRLLLPTKICRKSAEKTVRGQEEKRNE